MTSESDDALTWGGDEEAAPRKRPARATAHEDTAGRAPLPAPVPAEESSSAGDDLLSDADEDDERPPLSTAMLLTLGVVGGVYLLYSVGWVVGGLRLQPLARFFVADAMFIPWFVLSVAAPALWFLATWILTSGRAGWLRIAALLLGVVLLVPWPFVTVGVIGS